jgi:hypothetical protein
VVSSLFLSGFWALKKKKLYLAPKLDREENQRSEAARLELGIEAREWQWFEEDCGIDMAVMEPKGSETTTAPDASAGSKIRAVIAVQESRRKEGGRATVSEAGVKLILNAIKDHENDSDFIPVACGALYK